MKQKDILLLIIPLFIMVIAWIGFNVYHNFVSSTISENLSQNISPIQANFDTETIESLKSRNRLNGIYEISNITPSPTESNSASEGASINP